MVNKYGPERLLTQFYQTCHWYEGRISEFYRHNQLRIVLACRPSIFAPPSCRPDEGRISEFYRHNQLRIVLAYRPLTFVPPSCRPDKGRISEFYRHNQLRMALACRPSIFAPLAVVLTKEGSRNFTDIINYGWHWRTVP